MNKLIETEKAYLAGLIDGEGCIHISTQQQLFLIIGQCNETFLRRWQEKVGLGKVYVNRRLMSHLGNKAMYRWHLVGSAALSLLGQILPYLEIKKVQAEVALRYGKTLGKRRQRVSASARTFREECRVQLMELKKGESVRALEVPKELAAQLSLFP